MKYIVNLHRIKLIILIIQCCDCVNTSAISNPCLSSKLYSNASRTLLEYILQVYIRTSVSVQYSTKNTVVIATFPFLFILTQIDLYFSHIHGRTDVIS